MIKSLIRIGFLMIALIATIAPAGETKRMPTEAGWSPKHTFRIDQRSRPESGLEDDSSTWLWQSWIVPAKGSSPYRLGLWHDGELNWRGMFHISPNEQFIFQIQKTGSGENYGALFVRDANGRFNLAGDPSPSPPFSDAAWRFFRLKTGLVASLYHDGLEFKSWGTDGRCFEFSLHGVDLGESYWVSDWRLHYNTSTGRFFCTPLQNKHNLRSIHYRRK